MATYFLLFLVITITAIGFGIIIFLVSKNTKLLNAKPKDDAALLMLQNQINEVTKTLDHRLGQSTQIMQEQFGQSAKIIRDVTERLTKLDETNRQVVGFADQLQSLQDILKNPKQRGVLGEYYLETVLKNVLPPESFQMQYKFSDNEIVDAVVFVQDKIIPIDSKFSLENYNRITEEKNPVEREKLEKIFVNDLKMRITETSKYIRPKENTMEFAFMFIPHEAIYYDLLINKIGMITEDTESLIERAARRYHVIIVSPTSFLAYLQTVLQGLRALKIEESAKEIRKYVEQLGKHLGAYQVYFDKLGNNLGTTVNMYNAAYKEFKKIDKDVVKIAGGETNPDTIQLDQPKKDD
ncbi:MAG: DNA recombination protein RmuC [Candidatus Buchananbacteria bacterium]